ncbi:ABC transporter permease [Thiotrichales bacterium 19S9-12]|nr:ABC transporter permease [Thiotrichales bacterium 19S9-11]MCF6812561.1 ABC transporter permease [Thiotrichales bacterium 19S9-12]
MNWFSFNRFMAILVKEFIQMRRDPVTIGLIVIIPLIQLVIFGYAINVNPKQLPTAVSNMDPSPITREIITAIKNTDYFNLEYSDLTTEEANELLAQGKIQFIINIPSNFTRDVIRGNSPKMLVVADAADPAATPYAINALKELSQRLYKQISQDHNLHYLAPNKEAFEIISHLKYNPEAITQYNIIPGLIGVILTMTMTMITSLTITKERETGTIESLLATPAKSIEVILGKITPYIIVGYIQLLLILISAKFLFYVPIEGSLTLLLIATFPFILANLTVGVTFSTLAKTQLQAIQMTFFFFLPSILLSGFMFPFYGMPQWAQFLGNLLPLTSYLRIVRGIILKGNDLMIIWSSIIPLIIFFIAMGAVTLLRYKKTL